MLSRAFQTLKNLVYSQPFKMTEYSDIDFKAYNEYMDKMIGDYSAELRKKTFNDSTKTSYLRAIQYNADLLMCKYCIKKPYADPMHTLGYTDILDVILLSLHPKDVVKKKDISNASKLALSQMLKFQDLILLKNCSRIEAQTWTWAKAASSDGMSESYPAQMCLMTWFVTLVSKMTGFEITGNPWLLVAGRIIMKREEIVRYFKTITTITQAMSQKNSWDSLEQYSILKQMHKDINKMINKF